MADAEYAIDIAASMPDGELTIAQLDDLTAKLMGGGRNADHFQQAIQSVDAQLANATQAAMAANDALKAGSEEYRQLEKASLKAAKAAERAAVKNKGVVPPELAASAADATASLDRYSAKLRALEKDAQRAGDEQKRLQKIQRNLGKLNKHTTDQLGDAATKLSTFRGALGDVGGPLGEFGEKLLFPVQAFVDLNEWFGTSAATAVVAAVGFAALAAAVVALTVAAIAGVAAIANYAIKLADTKRNADLAREALVALHPELSGATKEFKAITNATGVAEDRLKGLSKKLLDAKVNAAQMPAALRAAATAEAALGAGGADKFIADVKAGKLEVDKFTTNIQQKFGGIVARQMMGLGAQSERLRRNFSELFGGLEITPALGGLNILVSLFDKSTVAGKTAQKLFESVFQPIIDKAQNAAYYVKAFYLGFLIGLTKIYIALKPAIQAIGEFFGFEDTSLQDILAVVTKAGTIAAYMFAGFAVVIGVVGAAVTAFIGILLALPAMFLAIPVTIYTLVSALIEGLGSAINYVVDLISNTDFAELGMQILRGLAAGINSGISFVVNAVKNAMGSAISAAKSVLGIASPSKVFADIGVNTGEGFEEGVDDSASGAQSAMAAMVEPPAPALAGMGGGASDASTGGGEASSGAGGINLSGATFNFYGVQGAEHAQQSFGEMLTRLLEGDLSQIGGSGPEGTPA